MITIIGCFFTAEVVKAGMEDAVKMGEETDKCFDEDYDKDEGGSRTIVMSTGVIGQR